MFNNINFNFIKIALSIYYTIKSVYKGRTGRKAFVKSEFSL